jgi:hypothetical protein
MRRHFALGRRSFQSDSGMRVDRLANGRENPGAEDLPFGVGISQFSESKAEDPPSGGGLTQLHRGQPRCGRKWSRTRTRPSSRSGVGARAE